MRLKKLMAVRDAFAASALQGLLSTDPKHHPSGADDSDDPTDMQHIVRTAFMLADLMMQQRVAQNAKPPGLQPDNKAHFCHHCGGVLLADQFN